MRGEGHQRELRPGRVFGATPSRVDLVLEGSDPSVKTLLRPSIWRRVRSISWMRTCSFGSAVRYSAARTLGRSPSRAYFATARSFFAHKINPTGGFSSG